MQEVEFSFFTLPDSGAFLTHAPRRLPEAFALLYPFQMEVWPALIFTIIITGPILYLMIIIPQWLIDRRHKSKRFHKPEIFFDMIYIREITRHPAMRRRRRRQRTDHENVPSRRKKNSFGSCVWFTCRIFLRQCKSRNSNSSRNFHFTLLCLFSIASIARSFFQLQIFRMTTTQSASSR
jgi:hypothetical protein